MKRANAAWMFENDLSWFVSKLGFFLFKNLLQVIETIMNSTLSQLDLNPLKILTIAQFILLRDNSNTKMLKKMVWIIFNSGDFWRCQFLKCILMLLKQGKSVYIWEYADL